MTLCILFSQPSHSASAQQADQSYSSLHVTQKAALSEKASGAGHVSFQVSIETRHQVWGEPILTVMVRSDEMQNRGWDQLTCF